MIFTHKKNYYLDSILRNLNYILLKRLIDFIFSLILIVLLIPLFLIIGILIKLNSEGSIIYVQKRIGRNNKPFACYKFRTMQPQAKYILKKILFQNPEFKNEFKNTRKLINDPRITNIGKFLRFTSLDELPQIFNVFKGDMSFIGPRPIIKSEIKKYGKDFKKAFSVKPGISGLWQVSGRNKLPYKKRVELDIVYAKNINLILDFKIFIKTLVLILFPFNRGAF